MKKISRKDLQGLRRKFPVLEKEEMRRYVGGYADNYCSNDWFISDFYSPDLGVGLCDVGYNGYGGYYGGWDFDGGYLYEVIIYGSNPHNNGYPGSNDSNNGYPGWGEYSGYWGGYSYWGDELYGGSGIYGEDGYYGGRVTPFLRTDCVAYTVAFALGNTDANIGRVSAWIESKYGSQGVPGRDYYGVLDYFFHGSPTPIPPYEYHRFGENAEPALLAAIRVPNTNDGHAVYISNIRGAEVTYIDPQNRTVGTCTTMDIIFLYRVDGRK